MNDSQLGRRALLAGIAGGSLAGLAGCVEPMAETGTTGSSSNEIDQSNRADGSTYSDVYESVIASVTQVRAFGVDSPLIGAEVERGEGSAFLYDERHVVTNEHVVAEAEEVDLQYITGDWTGTTLVGTDVLSDLAVLEVDHVPEEAPPLTLAEERPSVGQEVLAIGNPFGLEGSMTQGVVSGVDRTIEAPGQEFSFPNVVQTDAAVNPGNSGGPLVDLDGSVVGVVNAGGGDNIGFAISAALTDRVVPTLLEDGEYEHPFMGINLASVDRLVADENDIEETTGVIVVDVLPDGPAAGVLEESEQTVERGGEPIPVGGDVIISMDETPIPDRHALSTFLALEVTPGQTLDLEIRRDGQVRTEELVVNGRTGP